MRRLFNNLCKYKVVLSFNFRDVNLQIYVELAETYLKLIVVMLGIETLVNKTPAKLLLPWVLKYKLKLKLKNMNIIKKLFNIGHLNI